MNTQIRILGALAGVIVVALIVWVALDSGDSSSTDSAGEGAEAEIVSVESLRSAAEKTPIYWVGPPDGSELELSQPSTDRTYVRYLTGGADAGDQRPFLTVGSYEFANPTAALRGKGKQADGVLATAPNGGVVYFSRKNPESVYLAYPGIDTEIEVFAPDFQQALQLVTSGRIVPVE
ncbi:MAG TPA: hypothetical protein VFM94_08625 [Solirubrobacterales bacterium]|nr:hypothetical protein [Solirubrobacterales bacterium]